VEEGEIMKILRAVPSTKR